MKIMNYTKIPSTVDEDLNKEHSVWKDGKYMMLDEGPAVTVYLGHRTETVTETDVEEGEQSKERTVMTAFPVRVRKPLARGKVINAAEMCAYGLESPMDVASFGASLARKSREDPEDSEVVDHDEFIRWIKQELDSSGLFPQGGDKA